MPYTILVAEDDPAGQQVIETILQNQGYDVVFASTGKDALKKAAALRPDLILLDIMMPEMDGIQVCQTLRRNKELVKTPIIMLTALNDRDIRIACLDAGADDFFTKPFDRAELRARVRSITKLNQYRLLYERNQMFSWISEKSSDGYVLIKKNDECEYANPRARFFLGMDVDTNTPPTGKFMEIVTRQYAFQPQSAWENWLSTDDRNSMQARFLVRPESNTAHEFWLEATVLDVPQSEGGNRIVRLRDVTADILERRNTRSFGEAITHKVRTPVTHMISSLDLLARHASKLSTEEIVRLSETALIGARRLNDTLDRVLKYSRIGTNINSKEGFELKNLAELVERVSSDIGISGVQLSMPEELKQIKVVLLAQSVEVLLWEILGNSKKFHPSNNPTVSIQVLPATIPQVILQVSDDGISLSPRQLNIAWLPYYQGEKDFTGEAPGVGLGLSTVNSIVWGAGGSSRIMNREGGPGVVVRLTIPIILSQGATGGAS